MKEKLSPFDPAELLNDDESIEFFLQDALETKDTAFIAGALTIAERARKNNAIRSMIPVAEG